MSRTYRNGEPVGYSDEYAIVSKHEWDEQGSNTEFSYTYEGSEKGLEEARQDIKNGELDFDDVNLIIHINEWFDGTDYEIVEVWEYDDKSEQYVLIDK